ncbi:acyltransferase [Methanobrevibacter sp.]|uniref:acyltransferase n=1 Tax=Methanobrevibacter sp. TaxID=66852 RepID=UPI00389032CB
MYGKERIYYLDILKFLAIFGVVFIHVTALGNTSEIKGILISNFGEIFKFAVPIFLMVTGTLLLNRDYESTAAFLKRRFSRIIPPYILWIIFIIFAVIYPYLITNTPIEPSIIYTNLFNFPHTWYFWLMIGAYFIIPVINAYIKTDDINASKYLVLLFIVSSILYQTLIIFGRYTFIDLRFFITPVGYLSLGYLLSRIEFKNKNLIFIVSIILFIITSTIEVLFAESHGLLLIFTNLPLGIASFIDVSIVRIIQVSSVFLFVKYLPFKLTKVKRIITSISRSCYGIFFVHIFVNLLFFNYVPVTGSGTKVFLTLIAGSVLIFVISWIIVLITSKIPYLNKFSGYD